MKPHVRIALRARKLSGCEDWPCEVCGKPGLVGLMDVHHIEPRGMGGRKNANTPDNLIICCRECHSKAHGPDPLDRNMLRKHVETVLRAVK